jgi:hypothetical protein
MCRSETAAGYITPKCVRLSSGMRLALPKRMAKRRAEKASVGVTSNGILVVNVLSLLSATEASKLRSALPARFGTDWFIGTAVRGGDVVKMLVRFDDAAAEAAAQFAGRLRLPPATRSKRRKRTQ